MNVEIEQSSVAAIERAQVLLAGVPNGLRRAIHSALPRAASHLRKESSKEIRKKYSVTDRSLREHQTVSERFVFTDTKVEAGVTFKGTKLALIDFQGSGPNTGSIWNTAKKNPVLHHGRWSMLWPGVQAKGHQFKGTAGKRFDKAFVGKVGKGGHIGIFEQTGTVTSENSDAIRQLMGDAPPQMLDNEEVREELLTSAATVFSDRLDHEVDRILNGWGSR